MTKILSVTLRTFIGGPCAGETIPGDAGGEPVLQTFAGRGMRLVEYELAVFTQLGSPGVDTICVEAYVHEGVPHAQRANAILTHLISAAT